VELEVILALKGLRVLSAALVYKANLGGKVSLEPLALQEILVLLGPRAEWGRTALLVYRVLQGLQEQLASEETLENKASVELQDCLELSALPEVQV